MGLPRSRIFIQPYGVFAPVGTQQQALFNLDQPADFGRFLSVAKVRNLPRAGGGQDSGKIVAFEVVTIGSRR